MSLVLMPLLILSFIGYFNFFSQRSNDFFSASAPAVTCSFIIVLLNIGGVLGILKVTSFLLLGFGIGLFLYTLINGIRKFKTQRHDLYSIVLLLLYAVGAFVIFGFFCSAPYTLYHYDNFSHWGIIARFLIRLNRFPTPDQNGIISFTSYPVGSACFIYYLSSILQNGSTNMMLGSQTFLIYSYYFSLFLGVQKLVCSQAFISRFGFKDDKNTLKGKMLNRFHRLLGNPCLETVIILAAVVFLLQYNTQLNNLLVDNLLSAAGLSGILICLTDSDHVNGKALELSIILGATLSIKNSGLFLAVFVVILVVMCQIDNRESAIESRVYQGVTIAGYGKAMRKKDILILLEILSVPVLIFVLWKIHCSGFSASKHSMSLSSYLGTLSSMSTDTRQGIINIIVPRMLSLQDNHAILITVFLVIAIIWGMAEKANNTVLFRYAAFVIITLAIYELGTLLMYEFSMSYEEVKAQNGADFFRYNGTYVTILTGCFISLVLYLRGAFLQLSKKYGESKGVWSIIISSILIYLSLSSGIAQFKDYNYLMEHYRDLCVFEKISNLYSFSEDDTVLVRYSKDYGIPSNGSNYFLLPCTNFTNAFSVDEINWRLSEGSYDYVIDLTECTVQHYDSIDTIAMSDPS